MGVQQASCEVGVNARTGRDWQRGVRKTRTGDRVYPDRPVGVTADFGASRAISGRYLSEDECVVIADLHRVGRGVRDIATELGRAPSTVSRELTRNGHPVSGDYLLLRPGEPVAARVEREHERAAAPVLPQRHRPAPVHRR